MGLLRAGGIALVGLLLAGCGGASGEPAPPPPVVSSRLELPVRPATLSVQGVDPCTLVSGKLREQFSAVEAGLRDEAADGPGCAWSGRPGTRGFSMGVRLVHRPIREFLELSGARVANVAGFGAVDVPGPPAEPGCMSRVEIADDTTLWASYQVVPDPAAPVVTPDIACERAHRIAISALAQLLLRPPR